MSLPPRGAPVTLPPAVRDVQDEHVSSGGELSRRAQIDPVFVADIGKRVRGGDEEVMTPPPQRGGSSSDGADVLFSTPSPPSSASSGGDFAYGSIGRRRRRTSGGDGAGRESVQGKKGHGEVAPTGRGGSVSVSLASDALGNLSPIVRGASSHHRELSTVQSQRTDNRIFYSDIHEEDNGGWEGRSIVPVLPDETTRLTTDVDDHSLSGSEAMVLTQSKADLEKARLATSRDFNRRGARDRVRYRFILGCSAAFMCSVVFVIIVSGITTIVANRSFAHLEVFADWPNGGLIPLKYGCHAPDGGGGISFPLHWRNVPPQATNIVVLFAHPGAIAREGKDPVHWFVTDIALNDTDRDGFIPANASANLHLMPEGARMHPNINSKQGLYWPPCHENGESLFVIHVYAIEAPANIEDFKDAREIINRFVGVPVARLTGQYGIQKPLAMPGKTKGEGAHGKLGDAHGDDGQLIYEHHGTEAPEDFHH